MLILSRKIDEEIIIGDEENPQQIKIIVVKMVGGRVYLGFDAPDNVKIDRKEIWDAKHGECQRHIAYGDHNNVENVPKMHKGVQKK